MRTRTGTVALVAALALWARPASAAAGAAGSVLYVTAAHVFLDAGARAGLAVGGFVELSREGRRVGRCTIVGVSDHHALCTGPGAPGDTFPLPAARSENAPPPPLEKPAAPEVVARRRAALRAAAFEKVDARDPAPLPPGILGRTELRIAQATWATTHLGPWQEERVEARIDGAPVGRSFALYADVTALHFLRRSGIIAARPDAATQLYVREVALAHRPLPGDYALALGRIRPFLAPGATVIDGAQAGWRSRRGDEVGLFGGAVPDEETLSPSLSRGALGAYWAVQRRGEVGSFVQLVRHEARVSVSTGPELGSRLEGEFLAQAWLARVLDLAADVRLGAGDRRAPGALDAVRLDLGMRPLHGISFGGSFRYQGLAVPERDGPGALRYGGPSRHADGSLTWEPVAWLTISALAGLATDLTSSLTRRFAGPELALPRLFGGAGGLSFGYLQETGWSPGRTVWTQALLRTRSSLQLTTRLSWFRTSQLGPYDEDELGLYAGGTFALASHVGLRVGALGRAGGLPGVRPFRSTGSVFGGSLDVQLAGQF